ncbi:MAG: hypothetical protein QM759_10955 [Terricaulis sp.]
MSSYPGIDPNMMAGMMGIWLIVGLAILVLMVFCWWQIFKKAGYNGALALVFLTGVIPLIGPLICLIFFIWFAFSQWPVLRGGSSPPSV